MGQSAQAIGAIKRKPIAKGVAKGSGSLFGTRALLRLGQVGGSAAGASRVWAWIKMSGAARLNPTARGTVMGNGSSEPHMYHTAAPPNNICNTARPTAHSKVPYARE